MAVRMTRAGVALTVGIIVLTGLIIGGMFWAKQTGEQARRDEAIAIAEQNLEEDSNKEIVLNDGQASEDKDSAPQDSDSTDATNGAPQSADTLPETGMSSGAIALVLAALTYTATRYYLSTKTA